jgi:hypothetical protein
MKERKRRNYHGVGLHPLFASSICEIRMVLMVADDNNKKEKATFGLVMTGVLYYFLYKTVRSGGPAPGRNLRPGPPLSREGSCQVCTNYRTSRLFSSRPALHCNRTQLFLLAPSIHPHLAPPQSIAAPPQATASSSSPSVPAAARDGFGRPLPEPYRIRSPALQTRGALFPGNPSISD